MLQPQETATTRHAENTCNRVEMILKLNRNARGMKTVRRATNFLEHILAATVAVLFAGTAFGQATANFYLTNAESGTLAGVYTSPYTGEINHGVDRRGDTELPRVGRALPLGGGLHPCVLHPFGERQLVRAVPFEL